jgi:hypothetical protein
MYRQLRDAFVLASDAERLLLDLAPDLVEIDKALVEVEELAPFSAVAGGRVDQLENKRSARHDALAAREEIAPDDADSGGMDFIIYINVRRRRRGEGGFAYFSSTLDLPADWLPTYEWKRLSTRDIIAGHEACIPQPAEAYPAPHLQRPRIVRDGVNVEQG